MCDEMEELWMEENYHVMDEIDLGSDAADTPQTLINVDNGYDDDNDDGNNMSASVSVTCKTMDMFPSMSQSKQCYVCFEEYPCTEFVYFIEDVSQQHNDSKQTKKYCGKNYLCQTCMMRLIKHNRRIRCPICKCNIKQIQTCDEIITQKMNECLHS